MPLSGGSSYGNQILSVENPQDQFQQYQAQDAALTSNSLEDSIRRNQIDLGKQQAHQETVKSQEIDEQWKAQQAYNAARQKAVTLAPAPGYTDQPDASQPQPPAIGTNPATGRPSLAMDNGAASPASSSGLPGNNLAAAVAPTQAVTSPSPGAPPVMANSMVGAVAPASPSTAAPEPAPPTTPPAPSGSSDTTPPLKPMNVADPSTYTVQVDEDKLQQEMDRQGYGSYGLQQSQARAKALTAVLDMHIKAHDDAAKQMKMVADAAAAIPQVDWNEPDPQVLQQQKNTAVTIARQQYRSLLAQGIIKPAQEAEYENALTGGWTPELQQKTLAIANSATSAHEQQIEALDRTREHREQVTDMSTGAERDVKTRESGLALGAQTSAAVHDQASLDSWYDKLPANAKKDFADVYKGGYSLQTVNAIQEMGRTEEQRVRDAEIRSQHDMLNSQRSERETFLEGQRLAAKTQDKAQAARDYSALTKLQSDERKAYQTRSRLAQELANAKSDKPWLYIQQGGSTKPSSQITDDGDKQAAISDMQARHDAVTDDLKEIINQKYDLTKDTGKVSRADALAAVEGEGKNTTQAPTPTPKQAPASAAPSKKTTPAPSVTKYTEAQVRAAATAKGKDPNAAVSAARAKNLIP